MPIVNSYYRGDDWDAFDQEWARIEVDIPEDWEISRAEFRVGDLPVMTFIDPVFPIPVSLAGYQTDRLKDVTSCYLAIYDRQGRKQTLNGSWTFQTKEKVV